MPLDVRIALNQSFKIFSRLPHLHGVALNPPVGVLARSAFLRKLEQKLAGKNQTFEQAQVLAHPLRVDEQGLDQLRGLMEHIVEEDRRIRQDDALDRRSEEHTSELQSPCNLVCRLLLEKKKKYTI